MSDRLLDQKVLIYDPRKCSGCEYCAVVCSFHHYGVIDTARSYVQVFRDESKPVAFISALCTHCEHPLCEAACPTDPKAITKDPETGLVLLDTLRCIGCQSCTFACPISIPHFDADRGTSSKCDFCDGDPLCAKYCSTGAIKVVTRKEAKQFMEEIARE
ncbi:MAG: 4Fe-4S dicluster domain-containing protein [Promethearchaeota archaeon]